MTPTDLIAKLESASEGSRELSDAVLEACGRDCNWLRSLARDDPSFVIPDPSRSLDAARALVPEGWDWRIQSEDGGGYVWIWPAGGDYLNAENGEAATPELALCAAVLRARCSTSSTRAPARSGSG